MTASELRESLRKAYQARTGINPPEVQVEDPYPEGHQHHGKFWRVTWSTFQHVDQADERTSDEIAADVLEFYSVAHKAHDEKQAEKKQRAEGFE